MTILFASDLDRTLIYSKNSRGQEVNEEDLTAVEWIDEKPTAFMTQKGLQLFQQITSSISFVPVTTRTAEQYNRVVGLYHNVKKPKYAIVSNGAVILEDGNPLAEWSDKVIAQMQQNKSSIEHVLPQLDAYTKNKFVLKVMQAESWFVYLIIDEQAFTVEDFEYLSQIFYQQGFTLSHQGRKVYIMPTCINKSTALQFVAERLAATTVYAAGDSMLDFDMVLNADHGFIPSHGEAIPKGGHLPPNVSITKRTGVLAGEEILKKLNDFLL